MKTGCTRCDYGELGYLENSRGCTLGGPATSNYGEVVRSRLRLLGIKRGLEPEGKQENSKRRGK